MKDFQAVTFFDLDGTLLDEHSQITPEVAQAMQDLRSNGVLPVIATGRTNTEVYHIADAAGISSLITMNGQHVVFEGKKIFSSEIAPEVCARLKAATKAHGHELGFYNADHIRVTDKTPMAIAAYNVIHSAVPDIDPDFYEKEPINMLLVLSEDGDEAYHAAFPELTFYRNGPYSIDIVAKGGSKGEGVRQFVKALQLEGLPTYAFGDGMNDLDLFKACEHRIAMGNAKPALKELATHITAKNTEGGIIQALRHFKLID